MKNEYSVFTLQEWKHLSSMVQLDAMTGNKQSELLYEKIKTIMETMEGKI